MTLLVGSSVDAGSNLSAVGIGTQTATFTLPTTRNLSVESVFAAIDNASTSEVTPEVTVRDAAGQVIATVRQSEAIDAGITGSATWALRLAGKSVNLTSPYTYTLTMGAPAASGIAQTDANAPPSVMASGFPRTSAHLTWFVAINKHIDMNVTNNTGAARDFVIFNGNILKIGTNDWELLSGVDTTVPAGSNANLEWAHSSDSGAPLVDLTDPTRPAVIAAGVYAVTVDVQPS